MLHCYEDGRFTLQAKGEFVRSGNLENVQVSDRLGNVSRKLTFDDGCVFSTSENDAIDQCFEPHIKKANFVHLVESKMRFVAIALLVTIVAAFSFFKWGLPAVSFGVANMLPQKVNEVIGSNSLNFLDDLVFEDSQVSEGRQKEIRAHFFANLVPLEKNDEITFTLHFRKWSTDDGKGIPNAFALPSGDIILTDAFVALAETQKEIDSVLLHEMGHVAHRHSLKMLIQSSLLTIAITMTIGDVSGLADLGVGLGSLLLTNNYSRAFEFEADQYAFEQMLASGADPIAFAQIMGRLSEFSLSDDEKLNDSLEKTSNEAEDTQDDSVWDYFSTHPKTIERIQQAEKYSQCFKQGLKVCN